MPLISKAATTALICTLASCAWAQTPSSLSSALLNRTALPTHTHSSSDIPPPIPCNGSDVGPLINQHLQTHRIATLGPGICQTSQPISMPSNSTLQGSGMDTTTLMLAPNSNTNLIESENFSSLQATASFALAPSGINVHNITLNGNYLAKPWKHPFNTILNSKGSCVAFIASRYTLNARVDNCPDHMLYSENSGKRPPFEPASIINIYGSVSGKECIVWRGPGDSYLQTAMIGLCAIAPMSTAKKHPTTSALYPDDLISGLLIDKSPPYDGTLEIGFAHIYGVFDGYAVLSKGNPRIKASHLVAESSAGALNLSSKTWGIISLLDIHRTAISHPNRLSTAIPPAPPALICPPSLAVSALLYNNHPNPPTSKTLFDPKKTLCHIHTIQSPSGAIDHETFQPQ